MRIARPRFHLVVGLLALALGPALVAATPATASAAPSAVTGIDLALPAVETHAISGTVRTPDGTAVDFAMVEACLAGTDQCTSGSVTELGFAVRGIPNADYVLWVGFVFGGLPGDLAGGWLGPAGTVVPRADASLIHLAGADVTGIEITLVAEAFSIRGRITGADDGTATVSACPVDDEHHCVAGYTDPNHSYAVTWLLDGTYTVLVKQQAPSAVPSVWIGARGTATMQAARALRVHLDPAHPSVSHVNVAVPRGRTLSGRVVGVDGRRGLTTAFACPRSTATPDLSLCMSGWGEGGTFSIRGLAPGVRYDVQYAMQDSGYAPAMYAPWGFAVPWGVDASVIMPNRDMALPTLRAPKFGLSLSGTIRDAAGTPVRGATVIVCGRQDPSAASFVTCAMSMTGQDGTYRVPLLMAGYYLVGAGAESL